MAETLATPEGSAERSPHGAGAGSAPLCWEGGCGAGTAEDCGGLASGGRCAPLWEGSRSPRCRKAAGPCSAASELSVTTLPSLVKRSQTEITSMDGPWGYTFF